MPTPPQLPSQAPPRDMVAKIGRLAAIFLTNYQRIGPIYSIRLANGDPAVVMAGPEAIAFMSHEGQDCWHASDFRRAQNAEYGAARTLVSADGDDHRRLRQTQRRGYARTALAGHHGALVVLVEEGLAHLEVGQVVAVRDLFLPIVVRQLGRAFLGVELRDAEVEALPRFLETVVRVTLSRHWPETFLHTSGYGRARQQSLDLAERTLDAHRQAATGRCPALVEDLLGAASREADFLPPADLRAAVLGPFIAGLDQVVNTCCFMLWALLARPSLLVTARREAEQVLAGSPSAASCRQARTLVAAMMETLRLYPVAPAIQGNVSRPFEYAGYQVESQQTLIVGTSVSHYLPEIYADPFAFDLGRFSEPRNEHQQQGAFNPFGVGRHRCLGAGLAEDMILLTMAAFLRAVDCRLEPQDYVLTIGGSPAPIPENLRIKLEALRLPRAAGPP